MKMGDKVYVIKFEVEKNSSTVRTATAAMLYTQAKIQYSLALSGFPIYIFYMYFIRLACNREIYIL